MKLNKLLGVWQVDSQRPPGKPGGADRMLIARRNVKEVKYVGY